MLIRRRGGRVKLSLKAIPPLKMDEYKKYEKKKK